MWQFIDDDHDECNEKMKFLESMNQRLQDKVTHREGQQAKVLAELARLRALVDESMMSHVTPSTSIGREN